MELSSQNYAGGVVIAVEAPRIVAACAIAFKDQVKEHSKSVGPRIVLDLRKVDFIDSSGLGAIVATKKQLADGQELELACLSPTVAKVFHLTRMDSVFTIHSSMDDLDIGRKTSS